MSMNQATLPATPLHDVVTRPILFSGPMVRALLEGRKTQTRRIVKPQFGKTWGYGVRHNDTVFSVHVDIAEADGSWKWIRCPFGKAGDRLWVRETWCHAADDNDQFVYNAEGNLDSSCCHYRADGKEVRHVEGGDRSPWVPSIHMPRWASRLTLEITKVRVERLNAIDEYDASAEGIKFDSSRLGHWEGWNTAKEAFFHLWESINGAGSWNQNPWVWVVEFKVV
jgi:hypothetical protein